MQREERLRLLIIDDFPVIVDRISRLLAPSSLVRIVGNIRTTRNLENYISIFQPDVVIMDLHVGHDATALDGIHAIGRIKSAHHAVKIIVFTNFADVRYREWSFANGADYFLDKAFESDRLPGMIATIYQQQF